MPIQTEIVVPLRSLHALSSSARMEVLRALRARRMTAAEVAAVLRIRKSSAHKHLSRLAAAGFVTRHDDNRVWVYYSLTPRGRHLVSSERPRFALLLAASVAVVVGGASVVAWRIWEYARLPDDAWNVSHISGPAPRPEFFTPAVAWAIALMTLGVAAGLFAAWHLRRLRRAYG